MIAEHRTSIGSRKRKGEDLALLTEDTFAYAVSKSRLCGGIAEIKTLVVHDIRQSNRLRDSIVVVNLDARFGAVY